MSHRYIHFDNSWSDHHHRRFMDNPSAYKQLVAIVLMFGVLVLMLTFLF